MSPAMQILQNWIEEMEWWQLAPFQTLAYLPLKARRLAAINTKSSFFGMPTRGFLI
jgi:hypothetical protein